MARTPKRLAGPAQLSAAAATKYSTTASTKAIIRHLHFFNADTVTRTVTWSIGTDAAGTRLLDAFQIGAGQPYDHPCYHVMEVSENLQAFADVANKVTLTVSGDEITLG